MSMALFICLDSYDKICGHPGNMRGEAKCQKVQSPPETGWPSQGGTSGFGSSWLFYMLFAALSAINIFFAI